MQCIIGRLGATGVGDGDQMYWNPVLYSRVMAAAKGTVHVVTYYSPETSYTVATLDVDQSQGLPVQCRQELTIVGKMPALNVGEYVSVTGNLDRHKEYGHQLQVVDCKVELPVTEEGIVRFLGSGLIRGVGPATAKKLVQAWGVETLTVLDQDLDRLAEIPRLGRSNADRIRDGWENHKSQRMLTLLLQEFGVTPTMAQRIHEEMGVGAVARLRENPYLLCQLSQVGFKTADTIAARLGIKDDQFVRVEAALLYVMDSSLNNGHTYLPGPELVQETSSLTNGRIEKVASCLLQVLGKGKLVAKVGPGGETFLPEWQITETFAPDSHSVASLQPQTKADRSISAQTRQIDPMQTLAPLAVYLDWMAHCETGLIENLADLMQRETQVSHLMGGFDWHEFWRSRSMDFLLTSGQKQAVQAALLSPFSVLTGGPGTGKTTTIRSIIELCEQQRLTVELAAPTGRAAKRMQETTGLPARTLHRLLEVNMMQGAMTFDRNEANPLEGDVLIVDEASMLDLRMAYHLSKAIPPSMHIMLVGDVDQLPSVSPGNVLGDVIRRIDDGDLSRPTQGAGPCIVRLEEIHRQSQGSAIVTNAHRIRQGEMPLIDNAQGKDFFFMQAEDQAQAQQICIDLVKTRLPDYYGLSPREIMLLSPIRRGLAGVVSLNQALQQSLNPPQPSEETISRGDLVLRARDPVMQLRNDYDKMVFNGDLGTLNQIRPGAKEAFITFDDRVLPYTTAELAQITLAYAVTIHKSQGSEYPAVVVPLMSAHWVMLQRNLLYTALTRAKQLVVVVGQRQALERAVNNAHVGHRYSGLYAGLKAQAA